MVMIIEMPSDGDAVIHWLEDQTVGMEVLYLSKLALTLSLSFYLLERDYCLSMMWD